MSTPFLAEIRMMSFGFPPKGWAFCNGQLLPINQNQALFSLLGTTFGGNGQTNFALPNLQGRTAIHNGLSFSRGEAGGEIAHTLIQTEMPSHVHFVQASTTDGDQPVGATAVFAGSGAQPCYGAPTSLTNLIPGSVSNVGGSQPHLNMQPYLTINFCIALQGIFPSQT
jgi:microcystin-dependent protein